MTRRRIASYCGATSLLDPQAALALDADRYALMLKHDGAYCQISTDQRGVIASVLSQAGTPLHGAQDLIGIVAGPPYTTLVGEWTGHTEAGIAEATALGYGVCHLFDCLRLDGRDLDRTPFAARHGALYQAASWCESEGRARRQDWRLDDRGAAHATVAVWSRDAAPIERGGAIAHSAPASKAIEDGCRVSRPGRYVAAIPRDIRRLPISPLIRGRADARALLDRIPRDRLEGAVAVNLHAPVGARHAKRKVKLVDTLDGAVLASDATASFVRVEVAHPRRRVIDFTVPGTAPVGSTVEVAHNGWYASGLPRFARMVRVRRDKSVANDGALVAECRQ